MILFESFLNKYFLLPCISDVIAAVSSSVIFSAVFSTFLIATDRFYAVTSPLHYSMTITRSRSQVMIVLAWVSGIALALPYALLCAVSTRSTLQRSLHVIFTILQASIGYIFPFVGLCWLYLRMYNAAHRNSERTRKHSISGDLLTVMDGSTSVIPQGIDFLTHYMNPFTRTPMAGSVPQVGNGHQERNSVPQIVPVVVKKRRRSSNGSSSSLLFREEGRAIKTAFFVLASFFVCWTPHFAITVFNEIYNSTMIMHQHKDNYANVSIMSPDLPPTPEAIVGDREVVHRDASRIVDHTYQIRQKQAASHHYLIDNSYSWSVSSLYGSGWGRFFGVFGMLLSSVLNPFIYVFRNKIACEEITRLLYGLFGFKLLSKGDHHSSVYRETERKASCNETAGGRSQQSANDTDTYDNDVIAPDTVDYQPRYSPCIGKSPKRSSMKSLTPQSSINSTMTNCNSMITTDSPNMILSRVNADSTHHHITFSNGRTSKPPFTRSLTLPEQQTQPRVKFPPNLTRQKSYASYRPHNLSHGQGSGPSSAEITPANSKRSKFMRQDSVCSIMSNDSVLMICSEDGMEVGPLGVLNLGIPTQPTSTNGMGVRVCGGIGTGAITRVPEDDSEEEVCPSQICGGSSIQTTPVSKCYLRQDSNFSDVSHKTNDSGVVLTSICSNSTKLNDSGNVHLTPERCRSSNARQCSPTSSPGNPLKTRTPSRIYKGRDIGSGVNGSQGIHANLHLHHKLHHVGALCNNTNPAESSVNSISLTESDSQQQTCIENDFTVKHKPSPPQIRKSTTLLQTTI